MIHSPTQRAENFRQEGRRSNAIDVVITKDDKRFISSARDKQPFNCGTHIGNQEGVSEVFEPRFEKARDWFGFTVTPIQQALGEQR